MRKLLVCLVATGLLAGPMAAGASANPILELSCRVQDALGVENVQDCDFS